MNIGEASDTQVVLKALTSLPEAAKPKDARVWDAAERLATRSGKALGAGMTAGIVHYERPASTKEPAKA